MKPWRMSIQMNGKWDLDNRTWQSEKATKAAARKHAVENKGEWGTLRYHIFPPCIDNGSRGIPKIHNGFWMMKW